VTAPAPAPLLLHAGCVAAGPEAGLLILGRAGAGKSSLALLMLAWGARLVADDRTLLTARDGALFAAGPPAIAGLIEARGVGLLRAEPLAQARLRLAVDLDTAEPDRLPPRRRIAFCGCEIDLVRGPPTPHLAAALVQYLRGGRAA
jgi:HPr kinase/phosphorylase